MLDARDEELLAVLPDTLAPRMRAALIALAGTAPAEAAFPIDKYPGLQITRSPVENTDASDEIEAVFETARFPEGDHPVHTSELDGTSRALAELVASRPGLELHRFRIPHTAWARRRWLGLDPPGAVEREIEYTLRGRTARAPLWAALADIERAADEPVADGAEELDADATKRALVDTLPVVERLEALTELTLDAYDVEVSLSDEDEALVTAEAGPWARAFAERLTALFAPGAPASERGGNARPNELAAELAFRGLVRGGIELDPRWDWLCPASVECLGALSEERRGAAMVRQLEGMFTSQALGLGESLLESFASRALIEHLLVASEEASSSLLCTPRREYLARVAGILAGHAELHALVAAHLAALPPLPALRTLRSLYVSDRDQLTEGQRTQLEVIGKHWDLEYVSAFEIVDADDRPAYEALLHMDEDGAVCVAGTTRSVAYVSQMGLECNMGPELHEALHALLRVRPQRDE